MRFLTVVIVCAHDGSLNGVRKHAFPGLLVSCSQGIVYEPESLASEEDNNNDRSYTSGKTRMTSR